MPERRADSHEGLMLLSYACPDSGSSCGKVINMKNFWRILAARGAATLLIATAGTVLVAAGNPPAVGVAGPSVYVDPVPVWCGLALLAAVSFVVYDRVVAARSRSASAGAEWNGASQRAP